MEFWVAEQGSRWKELNQSSHFKEVDENHKVNVL